MATKPRDVESSPGEPSLPDEGEDASVTVPVDTDDNDEPNADASGDSADEKRDENKRQKIGSMAKYSLES